MPCMSLCIASASFFYVPSPHIHTHTNTSFFFFFSDPQFWRIWPLFIPFTSSIGAGTSSRDSRNNNSKEFIYANNGCTWKKNLFTYCPNVPRNIQASSHCCRSLLFNFCFWSSYNFIYLKRVALFLKKFISPSLSFLLLFPSYFPPQPSFVQMRTLINHWFIF